jgi:hypothetical protein
MGRASRKRQAARNLFETRPAPPADPPPVSAWQAPREIDAWRAWSD